MIVRVVRVDINPDRLFSQVTARLNEVITRFDRVIQT